MEAMKEFIPFLIMCCFVHIKDLHQTPRGLWKAECLSQKSRDLFSVCFLHSFISRPYNTLSLMYGRGQKFTYTCRECNVVATLSLPIISTTLIFLWYNHWNTHFFPFSLQFGTFDSHWQASGWIIDSHIWQNWWSPVTLANFLSWTCSLSIFHVFLMSDISKVFPKPF